MPKKIVHHGSTSLGPKIKEIALSNMIKYVYFSTNIHILELCVKISDGGPINDYVTVPCFCKKSPNKRSTQTLNTNHLSFVAGTKYLP